jgi:hypothetical protein
MVFLFGVNALEQLESLAILTGGEQIARAMQDRINDGVVYATGWRPRFGLQGLD